MGFRVWGFGLGVCDLGHRVFKVWGSRLSSLGFGVAALECLGFRALRA